MFPRSSFVVSKHCAIVCLKQDLELTDTAISLDERCVTATVKDAHHTTICQVASVYMPAQVQHRHAFLSDFMSLPFWSHISDAPWILLGDFNIHLHNVEVARGRRVKPFVDWLQTYFFNCFSDGTMTLPRAGTTIDYIFGHPSLATRLVNAQTHHIPQQWTDHSLLSVDLITSSTPLGPGCWRFNPYLLEDPDFRALLDHTVQLFLTSDEHASEAISSETAAARGITTAQEKWESLKLVVQYTKGRKARIKARVASLQRERAQLIGDQAQSARVKTLEALIERKILEDTRQAMLRSATRWMEQGEQNNAYFFRVIQSREAQATIQSLKKADTGEKVTDMGEILKEARSFYMDLYSPDPINLEAVHSLFANIPADAKLQETEADRLVAPPSTDLVLGLLAHPPKNKSPGLDGLPFEVYNYLVDRFPAVLLLLQQLLTDAL